MKSLFSAVATVVFSSTITFGAMAVPSIQGALNGPLQAERDNEPADDCTEHVDGSVTCCGPCGNGRTCCVTIGPIQ